MAVTGILGKKIGMTQVFDEKGDVHPITVLQAGPCVITQLKTLAREAGWALGHGGAGAIESAQRQDVDFAEQVGHGTRRELLLQLVVGLPGGVSAGAMFQAIGPLVVGGAVAAVGEGAETR